MSDIFTKPVTWMNNTFYGSSSQWFGGGGFSTITYVGVGLLVLFGWEHSCRLHKIQYRPTTALNALTKKSRQLFTFIGATLAELSSYLTWIEHFLKWIDLKQFYETFSDLFQSSGKLVFSFLYVLKGYFDQALKYVDRSHLIYLGSLILIGIMGYVYMTVGFVNPLTYIMY